MDAWKQKIALSEKTTKNIWEESFNGTKIIHCCLGKRWLQLL